MLKIAFFSNTDFSLFNFRMGLMKEMKRRGYEVYACGSVTDKKYVEKINKEGIVFINTPIKRGIDVFGGDLFYYLKVLKLCKREKFDICHNFTVKPCVYASLAQKRAGAKNIYSTITGIGYSFEKSGLLRKLVIFLYKKGLNKNKKVIFQNPDDRELFINLKIVEEEKTKLIRSSGVNTKEFSSKENSKNQNSKIHPVKFSPLAKDSEAVFHRVKNQNSSLRVVFVGRMLKSKGVGEFVGAAKKLKERHKDVGFLMVGPIDKDNPSGIPKQLIDSWEEVDYLGEMDNIREMLSVTDIFVFPSYYREGVPKTLLEAGSMEIPLITTDVPGCREAVEDGVNGFLVKAKDINDLVEKIEVLINNKELREKFGKASREKMIRDFDEKKVVEATIKCYKKE